MQEVNIGVKEVIASNFIYNLDIQNIY